MPKGKNRNAKGQGSFTRNDNGTVTYRKGVGFKADGNRKTLTVTAATEAACIKLMKQKEAEWLNEKRRTQISESDNVEELCQRHLEFQIQNGELKPKSIDRREDTIRNQIGKYQIGKMQIQAITPADVENHISTLIKTGLSVSTIKKCLDVLNAAYEWAVVRSELSYNPVLQIKRSIAKRLSKLENKAAADADVIVLSVEEEEAFYKETQKRNANNGKYKYAGGLYGALLLHTGMRTGEMIILQCKDYDAENGLLTINKSTSMSRNRKAKGEADAKYVAIQGSTKNQKARVIKLSDDALIDMKRISEVKPGRPDELICRTKTGRQYTATMLEHCMGTIYKHTGFLSQVSGLHILRRTFATRMYENGADVKEIAAYIGDLESTTMQYYIAARKKVVVGDEVRQFVPLPGSRGSGGDQDENGDAPAANRSISE